MKSLLKSVLIFPVLAFFLPWIGVQAQVEKEVRVVKPYTPTLSDARKLNLLPEFNDSVRVTPDFNYSITPKRYGTHFQVRPIRPARMVGMPLERLYKSQLSLGIGNYFTPYAELTINKLRSRKTDMGLYLRHLSSSGKVRLDNNLKVPANYSDNDGELYGKRMFYRSVLEGGISGGYHSSLYYGINPELDTLLQKKDIRQKIYSAGARLAWYSANPDSLHFNYHFGMNYQLTHDAFSNTENAVRFKGKMETFIGDWYSGLDAVVGYYGNSAGIDSFNNLVVSVNPFVSKSSDEWRFLLGLNTTTDIRNNGTFHIYPRAYFQFNVVKDVLIPYLGVNGYREINDYRKILFENPFVVPGLSVMNTDHSLVGFFGLKGQFSSKMAFDVNLQYSQINDMYFFVNDTTSILQNQFTVQYDNTSLLKAGGSVTWNNDNKLQFVLRANYYNYSTDSLQYPWHLPAFDASISAAYNLRDKILVNADFYFTGKRYAPGFNGQDVVELKPFLDPNLSIEYRYTKLLSFFLKLNNFSATRYQLWEHYPAQRFQAMVGLTYAL